MVQDCWLEGSGAKCRPWTATALDRSRLSTPGCPQATRASGAISTIWFILVVTTTPGGDSPTGTAPPARPVPEPLGTIGRPWARLTLTTAATSAVLIGRQTTPATPSITDASRP